MNRTVSPRTFAAISVALVVILFGGASATALSPTDTEELVRPIVKLDESQIDINVIGAHAPVPDTSTGIGPGSQLLISRPDGFFGCSANFIWTQTTTEPVLKRNGKPSKNKTTTEKTTYVGAAGHCFLPEGTTSTHGSDADFDPALATVSVCVSACEFGGQLGSVFGDFVELGPVAHARQTKRGMAQSNDFGIVEIPQALSEHIRPAVPVWEGPSGIEDVTVGGGVCLYGNATGFGEVFATKARTGVGDGLGSNERYWKAYIPSFQGDSGTALVTCDSDDGGLHGRGAAGILTHISIFPETAIVGTTTSRAAEMVQEDTGISLRLMLEDGSEVAPPPLEPLPAPTPITPDEDVHAVGIGGSHQWEAGPFTRQAPLESIFFGDECSGSEPASEHCDYEFVDLDVPEGGAELTVTVSTANADADDFDLFVYGPDGDLVGSAGAPGTPPEVVSEVVTVSGVYTIGVDPYAVTDASYTGLVELEPPPPPPAEEFDGEISLGTSYTWTGAPPLAANPLFTCANPVNAFCDDELIKVNVPSGGATLIVDVAADAEGDDFDVCVYTPSGAQNCFSEAGDEHVELQVTLSGVYRVGVKSFLAPGGGYTGVATLR